MRGFTPILILILLVSSSYADSRVLQNTVDYYPEFKEFLRGTMAADFIPNFETCYNKLEVSARTFQNIEYELFWERINATEASFNYLETISELSDPLKECYDMADETAVQGTEYFMAFGSIQNYF
jgi:hypothetical protein